MVGDPMSVLLTVKQAVEKYPFLSQSALYQACEEKRVAHYRLSGGGRRGKIVIEEADLQAFLRECRVERHPLLGPSPPPA